MKITDKRRGGQQAAPVGNGLIAVAHGSADVTRARAEQRAMSALAAGRSGQVPTDHTLVREGTLQRMRKEGGSNVSMSLQKPRDIDYWWKRNNDFYDVDSEKGLEELRDICSRLYSSHPLIGSAIDIFSKWPVVGAEFRCKDEKLTEFYSDLFFDTLNYEDYLVDIGREYWSVGEAFPLGTWNETLGVWEADELVPPDDVRVRRSAFSREPSFLMRLPVEIRRLLRDQEPRHEYEALLRNYPDLARFAQHDQMMPVSNHLLKQIKFTGKTFHERGIPIMSRGLRAVLQEEMLNGAQDAISDRLATPLILARLGASATELGTQSPWIPDQAQIAQFEGLLDSALAADFRMLTTHFAARLESVFGRETMPNFDNDFERLTERILQVFGMSKTMLSGAGSGQTYAADALNRDLVTQLASTYQRQLKRFVRDRMLVVAEARGHYDYETRGGRRYPIMEEVLVVTENGEERIEERPKLLVPDLHLKPMTMTDEKAEEEFFASLEASNIPVSRQTRFANRQIDFDDEIERVREERIREAIEAQETRKAIYLALMKQGLPIPQDLRDDFEPKVRENQDGQGQAAPLTEGDPSPPGLGAAQPAPVLEGEKVEDQRVEEPDVAPALPPPSRPAESDEKRAEMPKAAALTTVAWRDDSDKVHEVSEVPMGGLTTGPSHIGLRLAAPSTYHEDEGGDE